MLHGLLGISSQTYPPVQLRINCPRCRKKDIAAVAVDRDEQLKLFHVVPIYRHTSTAVTCSCGAKLVSSLRAEKLLDREPEYLSNFISASDPALKFMVLLGIAFCIFPIFGFLWTGAMLLWARRFGGWPLAVAKITWGISILPLLAMAAELIYSAVTGHPIG